MTHTILSKTKIALAAALMLGGATVALANDIDESPSTAQATREWQQYLNQKAPSPKPGTAYGFYQGNVPQTQKTNQNR